MYEFVTIKIKEDISLILDEKSKKSHIGKQWIIDRILREEFKDELAEKEEKEAK